MANRVRVSILDSEIDHDNFIMDLDFKWYYGCLFSNSKRAIHDPANLIILVDGDDRKHHETGAEASQHEQKEEINLSFEDEKKKLVIATGDQCVASIFGILDEDGDGRVSTDEIMRFLERLNLEIPMEDLESAVKSASAVGLEFLTSMEFRDFYCTLMFSGKDENEEIVSSGDCEIDDMAISEAFAVFDRNGDGFISVAELSDVLCRLGLMEGKDVCYCHSMIGNVDVNGDGFVDLQEFRLLIARSISSMESNLLC